MAIKTPDYTKVGNTAEVGKSVPRVDGVGLVTGQPMFVDDLQLRGTLHVKLLGSPHAHARIKKIDTSAAEAMDGVVLILTKDNTPRVPHTTAGQGYPEPSPYDTFMFDEKVRFVGDRVAAVIAETKEIAAEARKKIKVQYEVLEPVLDPRIAKKGAVIHDEKDADGIHDAKKNVAAHFDVEIGSIAKGLEMADHIASTETECSYAQHCPIEPHVCLSYLDPQGRLVLRTSTQVPFHCRRIIAQCLEIPISQIRVIKPRVGGGFGTKQEVLLEDICGLASLRTGRPVKWEFTRSEEFYAGRTRHPIIVGVKMGVTKKGQIKAISMDALSNTGAYGTHSLTVLTNAGSKILPLYRSENYRFDGDAVYTNMPVGGAYRGYGGTQGAFAMETLIDEVCDDMGFDPIEFRQKNHIQVGESSPVWAAMGEGKSGVPMTLESCGLPECIVEAEKWMKFSQKRKRYAKARSKDAAKKRGVGMATLMQGSGIPLIDMGSASIKMNEDGSFNLHVGATDIGTGSDTVLAQIAAEVLQVPTEKILVISSDTDITPFDVGAYASSTTYISGGAVKKAAEDCLNAILEVAGEMLNTDTSLLEVGPAQVTAPNGRTLSYEKIINRSLYSNKQRQIMGQGSHVSHSSPPPFACHMAEVEVDTETGQVQLVSYVAACDCGVAINPKQAEGQVEGATLNGISYALTEQFVFDRRGKLLNANFNDYRIWTSLDTPHLQTIMIPTSEPTGPFGAKSVAEININGPIPAIANAIANATGLRLKKTPFLPETILNGLRG